MHPRTRSAVKFHDLWLPHLWVMLGSAGVATLFHACVILSDWPPMSETWTKFIIPGVLTGAASYLVLGPRLRLRVMLKAGKDTFGLVVIACMAAAPFAIVSQHWYARAAEHLDHLQNVDALSSLARPSCVDLPSYTVALHQGGWSQNVHTTGKRSETLHYDIYYAAPLARDTQDLHGPPVAWLVQGFHESLPSNSSEGEKDRTWDMLNERAGAQLDSGLLNGALFLRNEQRSSDLHLFTEAVAASPRYQADAPVLLLSVHHEPFATAHKSMMSYTLIALFGGMLLWMIVLLFVRVDIGHATIPVDTGEEIKQEWRDFVAMTVPRGDLFITRILVWANVIVFLALVFAGAGFMSLRTKALVEWGANNGPLVVQGGYERLIASTFLHGSIVHLVMNMGGLVLAGFFLEAVIGRWTFLLLYLLCGTVASMASIWWEFDHISVGASGAIFGLYGIVLALGFFSRRKLPDMTGYGFIIAIFALWGLVGGLMSPVTDNAAHVGGLACGFLLGIMLSIVGRFKASALEA